MRSIAARIFTLKNEQDMRNIEHVHSFIVTDIAGTLLAMKKEAKIVEIDYQDGTEEEKKEQIKFVLDNMLPDDIPYVFCITSYVSKKEFPEDKYYIDERDAEEGKELIPIEDILQREDKFITELGFLNINNYTQYNYKVAYIYGNELGKEVKEYLDQMLKK